MRNATKKFLSALLVFAMLLSAIPMTVLSQNAIVADATTNGNIALSGEIDGDKLIVTLGVENIAELYSGGITLSYDSDVIECTKVKEHDDILEAYNSGDANYAFNLSDPGVVVVSFYHRENFTAATFGLFKMEFSIVDSSAQSTQISASGTVDGNTYKGLEVSCTETLSVTTICNHTDADEDFVCDSCTEEMPYVSSGDFGIDDGNNVTYKLYEDGTLRFSGTGNMRSGSDWREQDWGENSAVKKIVIDDGITNVGEHICVDGEDLTTVIIPASVTSISAFSFVNCKNLTSIVIDADNSSITSEGLVVFNKDKTSLIRCFDLNLKEYTVPASVKTIENAAFYNCVGLEKISIPETVTTMGNSVFYGCTNLTSVNIPKTVTEIAYSVFENCTSLQSISLPENLKSIGRNAFGYCENLKSVSLPDSVTDIGRELFAGCAVLENVKLSKNLTKISDFCFIHCQNLKEIVVPEGIKEIGACAFEDCTALSKVSLPETLTFIDSYAFYDCKNLVTVSLPDSVTSTGNGVFSYCEKLESVKLSANLTVLSSYLFSGCTSLKTVTIPKGVETISSYAFFGCTALTSIAIPDGVTHIEYGAFEGCSALTSISIPDTVEVIDTYVFLDTAYYNDANNWKNGVLYIDNHLIAAKDIKGDYTVKEGTKTVGSFNSSKELTSIVIPESVTSLQYYAFGGCSELNKVELPDTLVKIPSSAFYETAFWENDENYENGILYTGKYLIHAKPSSEEWNEDTSEWETIPGISGDITVKDGIKYIIQDGFSWCKDVTSIKLPDSLEYVADDVFSYCFGLTEMVFPEKVSYIGSEVFYCCDNLKKVTILNPMAELDDNFAVVAYDTIGKFVLYGYDNSTAEAYAKEHNMEFVSLGAYDVKEYVNNTDTVKTVGEDNIFAVADNTVESLIININATVVIKDKDGKDVKTTDILKSGMTVDFTDANGKVIDTLTIVVPGDNDGDGSVSSADARTALRAAVKIETLNSWQTAASDVEELEKKEISSADARYILRAAVKLESFNKWMTSVK